MRVRVRRGLPGGERQVEAGSGRRPGEGSRLPGPEPGPPGIGARGRAPVTDRGRQISPYYNFLIFVKEILFPGPGNIEVHYNSTGFGKGKGKRTILQSTRELQ